MSKPGEAGGELVDVPSIIDSSPMGALQVRVVTLYGAVALLDGYDTLVIGFAAPSLANHLASRALI